MADLFKTGKEIANATEFNKKLEQIDKTYDELNKSADEFLKKQSKTLSEEIKIAEEEIKRAEEQKKLLEEEIKLIEEKQKVNHLLSSDDSERLQVAKERVEKFIPLEINLQNKLLELHEKQKKAIEEQNKALEEHKKEIASIGDELAGLLGGFNSKAWEKSSLGKIFGKDEFGVSVSERISLVGKTFANAYTPANFFASTLTKIKQGTTALILEQESAISAFDKATGTVGKYDKVIIDIAQQYRYLGIDTGKAAQALASLREGFTSFTEESKASQDQLILFSATMETFGISGRTTAEALNSMTKGLGLSTQQAQKSYREIFTLSQTLGVMPSKMANDFSAALPKISVFGDKAVQKFKELATVAKSTGIEVSNLLDLAEKFDTFEGAADVVGQLNAVLGGNFLDSMKLVETTDPTKRMEMLVGALKDAGQSFDQMGYYARKSITQTLGLKSVEDLRKLMTQGLENYLEEANKEAQSQERMNELMRKAMPIMDKLKELMFSFAISMKPVVDALKDAFDWFNKLKGEWGNWFVLVVPLAAMAVGKLAKEIISLTNFGFSKLFEKITSVIKSKKELKAVSGSLEKGLLEQGQAVQKSTSVLKSFGAQILLIGTGVALVVGSVALLAKSLKDLTGEQMNTLLATIGIIIGGMVVLGVVAATASVGTTAFGVSMLMVGGAIAAINLSLSVVIISLKGLFSLLAEKGKEIAGVAESVAILSGALATMGVSGLSALTGLTALTIGFAALSVSLALIKTDDLNAVAMLMNSISKITAVTANSMSNVANSIKQIVKSISELPAEKAMSFGFAVSAAPMIPAVAAGTSGNAAGLANRMSSYYSSRESSNVTNNTINQSSSSPAKSQTVVFQVGDRVLKSFIVDVVNNEFHIRNSN